jgi:lipoprotein-anchoring transpeptidase ErfK/SrfK
MGEAASHGCIRMVPDDAVALARRIQEAGGSVPLLIKD